MINKYKFASIQKQAFYYPISPKMASDFINNYNIYFNYYAPELPTHTQNLDYYFLDNNKSFDEQYNHIKTLEFPYFTKVFFYTDYKINQSILFKKISETKLILEAKKLSFCFTNLQKHLKIRTETLKPVFQNYLSQNQGAFDLS